MTIPDGVFNYQLEVNKDFPLDNQELFNENFLDTYRDIARATNSKDTGTYVKEEVLNGQKYFQLAALVGQTATTIYRDVFRRTFNIADTFPAGLPAGGPANIPHGITFPVPNIFHFTRIYGVIESLAAPLYVPVPNNNIHMEVNGTNIVLSGYPAAFNGFLGSLVIEYTKN